MTIHWKTVEQCFTMVLFVFQFYPECNFGKFINFGLMALSGVKGFNLPTGTKSLQVKLNYYVLSVNNIDQ